ncbi:MAG TPA: ABC-F family ATP-binding cassette domain-containing protein [Xanthobacteraceae bacterium]|nr:ABC-F family ATP-binding cassette domain-containing protein [Xanthobacteraceae bacterium]
MLVIDNVTLSVGGRTLLDRASAQIPADARVGLVGRNGVGKTTLFRLIAGEIAAQEGAIEVPRRTRIGRLAQEAPDGPASLLDTVLAADGERAALLAAAERERDPMRLADIQTRLADIGAHAAPARAAAILAGLGFSPEEQQRSCAAFSGGWRMRVALAAVLFAQPDLLLLDEPTNYLDLEGALWLEAHLARYPHSVIIVSHDRDLLDNAVEWILHLEGGKLSLYRGNYSSFERQRRARQEQDAKLAGERERERARLKAFVDRFRAKASKARQAQSRLKRLAKLEPVAAPVSDPVRAIALPDPEKPLSPPILALEDIAVGYEPGKPVLRRLTLRVDPDDRIALLGANGNGKSTLAKLIAGRLAPMQGRIVTADRLTVGYFAQHQLDELDATASAYDHIRRLMPDAGEAQIRARAGAMGFPGAMADTPAGALSGGEKARLMIGLAAFAGPHLIVLDEPTNHLDIEGRAALIDAINRYAGAVVLVSHDRHLLDACADRLWLVDKGTVVPFEGDLDDYRTLILRGDPAETRRDRARAPRAPSRTAQRRAAAEKREELAPLRRRIAAAEAEIARLSAAMAEMDAQLAAPDLFAREPTKAARLAKARAEAAAALARAENEWLEASAAYESEAVGS